MTVAGAGARAGAGAEAVIQIAILASFELRNTGQGRRLMHWNATTLKTRRYNPGCFIQCLAATTPSSFPVHGFKNTRTNSLVSNTKRMVNTRNINEQPVPRCSTHYALHRLPPWCQLEFARWSGNGTQSEHRVFVRTPGENVFKWKLNWVGVEVAAESWPRRQPAASLWQTLEDKGHEKDFELPARHQQDESWPGVAPSRATSVSVRWEIFANNGSSLAKYRPSGRFNLLQRWS
ncbi:predicted protein [Histoplasma capsulatum H143]|uniref:Uncharacterized protein n=1 Tax=Ajellomyces capsulatus (strain H143) TaxID=544712 RepID=C6HB11_AJECH|nr:predicted protein [Histoplasma capsulatum H143]